MSSESCFPSAALSLSGSGRGCCRTVGGIVSGLDSSRQAEVLDAAAALFQSVSLDPFRYWGEEQPPPRSTWTLSSAAAQRR